MSNRTATRDPGARRGDPWPGAVARAGMVARGVVVGTAGLLAVLVAIDHPGGASGRSGALADVVRDGTGRAALIVLVAGLAVCTLQRTAQARGGPGDGEQWVRRITAAAGAIAYGAAFVAALTVLMGSEGGRSGAPSAGRTDADVLGWPGGEAWVLFVATALTGVAAWSIYRGLSRTFMEGLRPPRVMQPVVETLGSLAMCAAGVVLWLAQVFLTKAVVEHPAGGAGLDPALARLVREPYGPPLLGAVAAGLAAFALYCFAEARYREF